MLRSVRFTTTGRGPLRGLFVFVVLLCLGCERKADVSDAAPDVAANADASSDVGGDLSLLPDALSPADSEPELEPLTPPWTAKPASLKSLQAELNDAEVGTLSGEIFGDKRTVRAVVRASCPGGTHIQALYDVGGKLYASPVVPLRFFALPTGRAVTYEDNDFEITVDLSADTPERLAGALEITYGPEKESVFMNLTFDGRPLTTLVEPEMPEKMSYPEFPSCHPSGWFRGTLSGGEVVEGQLNATAAKDGNGVVLNALFTPQTGMRFVVLRRDGVRGPVTLDLRKPKEADKVRIHSELFYHPELTSVEDAEQGNVGEEEIARTPRGSVDVEFGAGPRPEIVLEFRDLEIPMLLDGPLRGTTFESLRMEARAFPSDEYPAPPDPPSWQTAAEEQ